MHNGWGIDMKRGLMGAAIAALWLAAPTGAGAAEIDAELRRELAAASPATQVTAIATVARRDDRATARRLHRRGVDVIRFKHLPFLGVRGTPLEIRAAGRDEAVRRLSANSPIVSLLDQTRGAIGASAVQEQLGVTGKGVGVAFADSGVDEEHPDLADALTESVVVARERDIWALGADRPDQIPDTGTLLLPSHRDAANGHGTHIAGIIGGRGIASDGRNRGIAPGADLISVAHGKKVVLFALAAWDYILEHRKRLNIHIVNNSWGADPNGLNFTYDAEHPVNVASKALHAAGLAVVFGGGNAGPGPGTLNTWSPWPWVLSVAGGCVPGKPDGYYTCPDRPRDPRTGFALADFSSRGVAGDPLLRPDVTAPGADVVSARSLLGFNRDAQFDLDGTCGSADPMADFQLYTCNSGTSMAAPHVAGTMALLEEAAGCDLSPDQLYALVTQTASPMAGYAEWEVGSGFLDARAAVDRVRAQRDELCPKKDKTGTAKPPKPAKVQPAKAPGAGIALDPRPTATSRTVRVGLRPSTRLRDVRVVVRRGGRVIAGSRLARLDHPRTLRLRTRSTLRRGTFNLTVTALDSEGRRVTARGRFTR